MHMALEGLRSAVRHLEGGWIERGGVSPEGTPLGGALHRVRLPLPAALRPVAPRVVPLGLPLLDQALPEGGLVLGRMHEVVAEEGEAGTGFAAALLARILGKGGRALWCGRGAGPYAPGAAAFGIAPDRLILARTASDAETLWAMEEGLRCSALAASMAVAGGETVVALDEAAL